MNEKDRKVIRIETQTLYLLVITILLIIAIFVFPFVYISSKTSDYKRTDSVKDYLNDIYVSYNGGKEAQCFFNNFAKSDTGNIISFHYRDNDARFTLKSASHTVFVLDVEYDSESYNDYKESLWCSTNKPDESDEKSFYGSFLITSVILNEDIYTDNYCSIAFDDENCVIRYMLFYHIDRKQAMKNGVRSVKAVIRSSIMLDWNEKIQGE